MTDDFLHKLKNFDAEACRILYDLYKVRLFSVCRRYADSHDDANDMLQEGFLAVFNAIPDYKNQGNFEGFVRKVFLNNVLQYIRKNYRQLYQTDEWKIEIHDDITVPEAIANLSYDELLIHIQKLPDGYRTIFNLYVIDGYTHGEIAALLQISVGTSRSQYSRAKQILQKQILQSEKMQRYE